MSVRELVARLGGAIGLGGRDRDLSLKLDFHRARSSSPSARWIR